MKWSEVRQNFPNQIVLVEAVESSSENSLRTIQEMAVINDFRDNLEASGI
ncbi:hypothetical protein [Lentibacillus salicampi]|nr:hypothetical protein [Lentibacillus salicampi]